VTSPSAPSPADAVVKEMSLTRDDFFRLLPAAAGTLPMRVDGLSVELGTPERGVAITLEPLPPRRLSGLLSLPRALVTLVFHGFDPEAQTAFERNFDRAFQRGGG